MRRQIAKGWQAKATKGANHAVRLQSPAATTSTPRTVKLLHCCVLCIEQRDCTITSNNSSPQAHCNKCCQETEFDLDGGLRCPEGGRAWFINSRRTGLIIQSGGAWIINDGGACTKDARMARTTILLPLLQRPCTRYMILVHIQCKIHKSCAALLNFLTSCFQTGG